MNKNTEFIFIRHGITELNVKKVYFGQLDPALINEGIQQIQNTKKNLINENISLFYSSDLKRCTESAKIINESLNLDIIEKNGFRELNFGIFDSVCKQRKASASLLVTPPGSGGFSLFSYFHSWAQTSSSTLPAMQRALSEIKKQLESSSLRGSTSATLKPGVTG